MGLRWQGRRKKYGSSFGQNAGRKTFRSHNAVKRAAGTAKQNRRVARGKQMVKMRKPSVYRPGTKTPWKAPKPKRFKRRV